MSLAHCSRRVAPSSCHRHTRTPVIAAGGDERKTRIMYRIGKQKNKKRKAEKKKNKKDEKSITMRNASPPQNARAFI